MKLKRILAAFALAGLLGGPASATAACSPQDQAASASQDQEENTGVDDDGGTEVDPCELDDQHEGDRDCGHYSSPGIWAWYWWVVLGKATNPPAGWHRPYSYSKTKPGTNGSKAGTSGTKTGTKSSTTKSGTTGGGSRTSIGGSRTSTGGGRR